MALRVLFFGTPAFAVPSLNRLAAAGHDVVAVVTQPDRPKGRGHHLAAPPMKNRALELGLPVWQIARLREPDVIGRIRAAGADLAVVAAYGRILPQALLDIPRLGFINVHASLLPRWRGAAPIHRAILAGDRQTGITIMRVVLALDAGPVLAREATPIGEDETSDDLEARLAVMGGDLLVRVAERLDTGRLPGEAAEDQDERGVTYAAKLERRDGIVDWTRPAQALHNQIRGLHPWPLAAASIAGSRVLLRRSVMATGHEGAAPGTIVAVGAERVTVACGDGAIALVEVQPEGRRPMTGAAFLRGQRVGVGARFEPLAES